MSDTILMASENELLHDAISALSGTATRRGPVAGESAALRDYPLQVVPARQSCRRIIYTTKIHWLIELAGGIGNIPQDVAVLWRFSPLDGCHRALVRAIVQHFGAPLYFVGDLDPLDLVTYATLAEPNNVQPRAAHYLGISDSWLERCERDLAPRFGNARPKGRIAMGAEERDGFKRLKRIPFDWAGIIGTRALEMLGSGMKCELEGASNRQLYSRSFCDDLLRFIFDDQSATVPRKEKARPRSSAASAKVPRRSERQRSRARTGTRRERG